MKRNYKLFNIRALFFAFSALLLLASCSSYQYAGYDNDGIYSSDQEEAYTANDYEESYENALYYQQLFAEKADQFGNVPEEGAIFTDIDSYSSGAYDENMQEDLDYTVGRAAWGSDPDEIAINIYNDPFYYPYYGGYYPYYAGFYDPFWYPGYYGYGYYPYRYGYGYYNSWNIGFGFGFGWSSWRYGYPYYGYHRYPYLSHYYPYYSYRNVAYNTGRRDSYANSYRSNRTNLDARTSRVRNYSNPRNIRAGRSNYDQRTYQTRTSRVRSTSTPSRRSNSTYNRGRSSNNRSASQVRTTRSRSNNSSVRTRTSRSSSGNNSVRSSSSSSRSSGSTTSRSSRGRGN